MARSSADDDRECDPVPARPGTDEVLCMLEEDSYVLYTVRAPNTQWVSAADVVQLLDWR